MTSITAPSVARALGVSPQAVGRWARLGMLPGWRTPGGQWRFDADVVADWALERRNKSNAGTPGSTAKEV